MSNIDDQKPEVSEQGNGITRRKFLKILGTTTAAGAVGCSGSKEQNIYPRVRSDDSQVPGVSVWYSSTCTECSAGCGIKVRTVDGRAVKVEGDKSNPINRGGLCALGQASLQSLYDPDRIRQPLKRSQDSQGRLQFVPITWDEAYAQVQQAFGENSKKNFILTGETNGSLDELLSQFAQSTGSIRVTYDASVPAEISKAAELVFGVSGIPTYAFDSADVIVSFGADFLETWISPVEYARSWADRRRTDSPQYFVQVEPRLSLTGANADLWLNGAPGSEIYLALALIGELLRNGKGQGVNPEIRAKLVEVTKDISLEEASTKTGISLEKILTVAHQLNSAKRSLVVSGGTSTATSKSLGLHVAANLLNVVLENVGETVFVTTPRKVNTSASSLQALITALAGEKANVVMVYGTNPAFTLPSSFTFKNELRKAKLVVSFSSHLDETAQLADLILPSNHSLESWGDVRAFDGVASIIQPTMAPVFDTRDFGDMVLDISAKSGLKSPAAEGGKFRNFIKENWKRQWKEFDTGGDFESLWRKTLENGGIYAPDRIRERTRIRIANEAMDAIKIVEPSFDASDVKEDGLVLYPFFSVKTFDGRAANRPWLQELPDPITQIVWDSWAELHPKTAARIGLKQGDAVTVRNRYGEVNVPAYLTDYVNEGIIAIPVGQGHTEYGRFAKEVGAGNVFDLLAPVISETGVSVPLLSTRVNVLRGNTNPKLVITTGSNSQHDRELARTEIIDGRTLGAAHAHGDHENGHGENGHGHHEPKGFAEHDYHRADNTQSSGPEQMYLQREHPLYEWGMAIDLAACTGCSACVIACQAENNIPVVGKRLCDMGREMSWLRIERYIDNEPGEELQVSFLPMMCQHCHNAPCEPVCPVYATYHNEEGLNAMIYNRCVGTRYCSNNCSYKVRRFNWLEFDWPTPLDWQLNPDVTQRGAGVMEKCTFCVHKIIDAKDRAKDEGRLVRDGEVQPACVQSCPTQALVFGDLNDPESKVRKASASSRAYRILDHHINTQPAVSYLQDKKIRLVDHV